MNPFIKLLWEKGSLFEREVISNLALPFLDLSNYAGHEKERLTLEAMQRGEPLIYGGRIQEHGLLGDPDLLRKEASGYVAGDIKSGAGEEGSEDDATPKLHYAVQLALYTDILEQKGLSGGRRAFVWDIHGKEILYDFAARYGKRDPKMLWQDYEEYIAEARAIIVNPNRTSAALSSACKLCHWHSACVERLKAADDLTLIPELGRSKRDAMIAHVPTVGQFAACNLDAFLDGKKTVFPGIGPDTLAKLHRRAKLLSTTDSTPVLRAPIQLPDYDRELFFDIEVDPMRDICYLHGFIEREERNNETEKFIAFFADETTPQSEKAAFAKAWNYICGKRPCAIYYYSKYERTLYRKLQRKYQDVCSVEDVEELFDPTHAIDLYNDVVRKATEWPTWDFSIKTLAKYLGFAWRDAHPSGAASIEWFDRWIKTSDTTIRQRILDYNEDDCRATRVLLDGIRKLSGPPE